MSVAETIETFIAIADDYSGILAEKLVLRRLRRREPSSFSYPVVSLRSTTG